MQWRLITHIYLLILQLAAGNLRLSADNSGHLEHYHRLHETFWIRSDGGERLNNHSNLSEEILCSKSSKTYMFFYRKEKLYTQRMKTQEFLNGNQTFF